MKITKQLAAAFSGATQTQRITVEQAKALPGLLGRFAGVMLETRGWYSFTDGTDRILLMRPDVEKLLLS